MRKLLCIWFLAIFINLAESANVYRTTNRNVRSANLRSSRRIDKDARYRSRAKRQLELHIWKSVIASRHHTNRMKQLQEMAEKMMKNPPPVSVSENYIKRHNGKKIMPGTRMKIKGGFTGKRSVQGKNLIANEMQRIAMARQALLVQQCKEAQIEAGPGVRVKCESKPKQKRARVAMKRRTN